MMHLMDPIVPLDAPRPVKLTVEEFRALDLAGALARRRHAELIGGTIVEMSPQQSRHALVNTRLAFAFDQAIRHRHLDLATMIGPTVALPPHDAPEPDIVIAHLPVRDGYLAHADVALLAEVSDTTLRHDLSTKRDLYAAASIPELWVIDMRSAIVHQFWAPQDGVFTQARSCPLSGPLDSATLTLTIDGTGIV